jgi:hypothetical protein
MARATGSGQGAHILQWVSRSHQQQHGASIIETQGKTNMLGITLN